MSLTTAPSPLAGEARGAGSIGFVVLISLAAATGGLLFGFDTAVISGADKFFTREFRLDEGATGWVVGSVLIGCMAGAALAGPASDRVGRKKVMIASAVLFGVSAGWCFVARSAGELAWARVVGGVGVGIASLLSPLYIAEVAPPAARGRLVALQQLAIVVGILAAFATNAVILHTSLADPDKWRWMLGVAALPSAAYLLLLLPIPESPRWLVQRGRTERATAVLRRTAGDGAARELEEIRAAVAAEAGTFSELFTPRLARALLVGVALAVLQQVSGINAIMYYGPRILEQSGLAAGSAFSGAVAVGLVNLLFTLVGMALVDRLGRKPLLVGGAAGMTLSLVAVALAFRANWSGAGLLVPILAYVACFASTTGIVTWAVIAEIFPNRVRGRAMAVAVAALWIACYAVAQTFPILLRRAGPSATFLGYAVMCAVTVAFALLFVPETKGRTLEEIERSW